VHKFWESVKIWQSYRVFKGGNFFETQCRTENLIKCAFWYIVTDGIWLVQFRKLAALWNYQNFSGFFANSLSGPRPWSNVMCLWCNCCSRDCVMIILHFVSNHSAAYRSSIFTAFGVLAFFVSETWWSTTCLHAMLSWSNKCRIMFRLRFTVVLSFFFVPDFWSPDSQTQPHWK